MCAGLSHLDFLKYGLQFLSITEYKDENFTCDAFGKDASSMVTISAADAAAYDTCGLSNPIQTFPSGTPGTVLKCRFACGYDMLREFGVDISVDWQIESFVILHGFAIFFALAGFFALKYINHIKR